MARTALGDELDLSSLAKQPPQCVRRDGIYETPDQHFYDGMYLSGLVIDEELDRIKNLLELGENDVVSSGYPKVGSTWVNELIFLICNDANVELASEIDPMRKLPFLEFNFPGHRKTVDAVESSKLPRLLKSHLPPQYFQRNINKYEKGPKIVITMRNPKDTLVSYYHFYKLMHDYGPFDGDWNEYFKLFKKGRIHYGDMFDVNVAWWMLRDHPNVYIVKYEDLKKDAVSEIAKLAEFLGYDLTEAQIHKLGEATSFAKMKKGVGFSDVKSGDDPEKHFFRKGKVGDWRSHFTKEQSDYMDQLCREKYEPIGLAFDA